MLVDTGAAMALLGLRAMTDVDLIYDALDDAAPRLLSNCGPKVPGVRRQALCRFAYGPHNPPTPWFAFHNATSPEHLVKDPTLHAFYFGLKFVAPAQLLAYKRRRLAARGERKDARDIVLLESFLNTTCVSRLREQALLASGQTDLVQAASATGFCCPEPPVVWRGHLFHSRRLCAPTAYTRHECSSGRGHASWANMRPVPNWAANLSTHANPDAELHCLRPVAAAVCDVATC